MGAWIGGMAAEWWWHGFCEVYILRGVAGVVTVACVHLPDRSFLVPTYY